MVLFLSGWILDQHQVISVTHLHRQNFLETTCGRYKIFSYQNNTTLL